MNRKIYLLVLLLCFQGVFAQETDVFFKKANTFFQKYVQDTRVDYKAIYQAPSELNEILSLIKTANLSKDDANTYKAFYINTYNLLAIKGVVENYPLKSNLEVPGFFKEKKYEVANEKVTLDDIENRLLRAKFPKEPRFHFVLVCAAVGCPPIINEAYLPRRVNTQMEHQTAKALNDAAFIQVDGEDVKVSQIFDWYKEDFDKAGGILYFINEYRERKIADNANVSYYPYNWALNGMN